MYISAPGINVNVAGNIEEHNPMLWVDFYTGLAWSFDLKDVDQGNEWIDKIMESVQNGENIFVDLEQE
ncbi:hypothetical protein [Cetobacterium sp.]|uniref:hypothetical protein n=1 Tax=Cetobacterium sp. TaxID=2071632 RepID=UPI003F2C8608